MSAAAAPLPAPARSTAQLRERFRDGKAALIEHFRVARPTAPAASRLIRGLTRHVDATLTELWRASAMPPGAALVAVGGYGRAELFPHSDVDVLVLLPPAAVRCSDADAASPLLKAKGGKGEKGKGNRRPPSNSFNSSVSN